MIYLGADHRGFSLKESIKSKLQELDLEVADLGNTQFDPSDDYVDFAHKVSDAVASDIGSKGILFCGTGVGVDMVANKIDGIRSVLADDVATAKQGREHEDANVLALPADQIDENTALEVVQTFLETDFSGEERHIRRLQKMKQIEKTHE